MTDDEMSVRLVVEGVTTGRLMIRFTFLTTWMIKWESEETKKTNVKHRNIEK